MKRPQEVKLVSNPPFLEFCRGSVLSFFPGTHKTPIKLRFVNLVHLHRQIGVDHASTQEASFTRLACGKY